MQRMDIYRYLISVGDAPRLAVGLVQEVQLLGANICNAIQHTQEQDIAKPVGETEHEERKYYERELFVLAG